MWVIQVKVTNWEGINKTINLQCGNIISKIDDFKTQTIWIDEKKKILKYRPKDVGYDKAINQLFECWKREQGTVLKSTHLMLEIKKMAESCFLLEK